MGGVTLALGPAKCLSLQPPIALCTHCTRDLWGFHEGLFLTSLCYRRRVSAPCAISAASRAMSIDRLPFGFTDSAPLEDLQADIFFPWISREASAFGVAMPQTSECQVLPSAASIGIR